MLAKWRKVFIFDNKNRTSQDKTNQMKQCSQIITRQLKECLQHSSLTIHTFINFNISYLFLIYHTLFLVTKTIIYTAHMCIFKSLTNLLDVK